MNVVFFLVPWILIGLGVLYVAFTGGPSGAREAYLTRGSGFFRVLVVLIYLGMGVAIPLLVIGGEEEGTASVGNLAHEEPSQELEDGKLLFRETCASCHNLDAVNARGVTGPDLDEIGEVNEKRVLSAIEKGGTGQGRMPAMLLQGEDAQAVAAFVAKTAGKSD